MVTTKHEKKRDLTAEQLYGVSNEAYMARLSESLEAGTVLPEHDDLPTTSTSFAQCACGRLYEFVVDYGGGVVLYWDTDRKKWWEPENEADHACHEGLVK